MKLCLTLILILIFNFAAFGQTRILTRQEWTGYGLANDLKSAAPGKEFISDQSSWKRLWRAWRENEKLPKIDFRRQIIVFCTTISPNHCSFRLINNRGNLKLNATTTLMRGNADQFSYRIALIDRAKIKAINGKMIAVR